MRKLFYLAVAVAGLGACAGDQITVQNLNNPDVSRVLATPADVESVIGNSYGAAFFAAWGSNVSVQPMFLVMSFESASSLSNFGNSQRGGIPRQSTNNTRGNPYETENANVFTRSERAARTAANGIAKLNGNGFTLGSPSQDLRARAFAYFVMGYANANIALAYDSTSVVSETDTLAAPVKPLVSAKVAMALALTQMDSAIATAGRATALGGFVLPTNWVPGNAFTDVQFVQMVRSYKARFRAGVARNPAERSAIDWTQVIADANAGLPADLVINTDPNTNFTIGDGQHYTFDTWTQQSPMIIGMADSVRSTCSASTAGGDCYDAWLANPAPNRYAFTIRTADQRFPAGATRAAQRLSSGSTPSAAKPYPPSTNLYFRNRTVPDPTADPWNKSQYDFYRFQKWASGGSSGSYPVFTRAEANLLAAEGYIRAGDFANAMATINVSRVANGQLPALVGIGSPTQPIAAGVAANSCVPRVPTAPDFAHATCGTIFEAMKWEKRMETAYTHFGAWFFDSRGWGDLVKDTPVEFPVPTFELDVRVKPYYSTGGPGGNSAAPLGTYGY
ncbi:MAG TPA: hypothetical protein VII66_10740 [Gemmatimonadaceae bacterium]